MTIKYNLIGGSRNTALYMLVYAKFDGGTPGPSQYHRGVKERMLTQFSQLPQPVLIDCRLGRRSPAKGTDRWEQACAGKSIDDIGGPCQKA